MYFDIQLDTIGGIDEPQAREEILDALQLRFSLVGGMFEAIQHELLLQSAQVRLQ